MSIEPGHPPLPRLLELHEVAYQLRCCQETVRRYIRERKLLAIPLGRHWRVDPADLKAFLEAQRAEITQREHALDQGLRVARS